MLLLGVRRPERPRRRYGRDGSEAAEMHRLQNPKVLCKSHQRLNWKWEHKGECTVNVPSWLREEYARDRTNNLNGSYDDYATV